MSKPPETLLETRDVRVRIMTLLPGEKTDFHHHSEVIDRMVCLSGVITINCVQPEQCITLSPGELCEVDLTRRHQVVNPSSSEEARYLLIQGVGRYDFITDQQQDASK